MGDLFQIFKVSNYLISEVGKGVVCVCRDL